MEPEVEQRLYSHVKKIDPAFKPDTCRAEDLNKSQNMTLWIDNHCTITPYSFIICRCGNILCCGAIRSPTENGIRNLVFQRQPTPKIDKSRKGLHYYTRADALRLFGGQEKSYVDLSDLPSKNNEKQKEKDSKSKKVKRDAEVSKALKLKSWEGKKVFAIVKCFHCDKPRCLLTRTKDGLPFYNARKELKDRLESISHMYSCGDLIFKDDEASGKVITQRLNLSCESPIEKCYYNTHGRAFETPDICIHCGAGGSSDFIFGQKQLEDRKKTGGRKCYPICKVCFEAGEDILKYPKKKTNQAQKRKEVAANKSAQRNEWNKRRKT